MRIVNTRIQNLRVVGQSSSAVAADEYFNLVSLLLPGNGTNGAQNNTFLDSSTNNLSITRNGNPTQGTFSPFSQTGWSNYFDGTGDYLTLSSNTSMDFGTGNFTIEGWFYTGSKDISGGASRTIIGNSGNGYTMQVYITTSGYLTFGNTGSTFLQGSTDLADNAWHHFAIARKGTGANEIAMWVDGVRVAQFNNSQNYTSGTIFLGSFDASNGFWNGYLSNLRIVKGTAVYDASNSTITVPNSPLTAIANTSLLTCQSNRFVDNSANAFAITVNGNTAVQAFAPFDPTAAYSTTTVGGSGYFDGSGDWLTVVNPVLNYGTSDFSLEFWVYPTTQGPATYWWSDGSSDSLGYYSDAADQWRVYLGTSAASYNIFLGNNLTGTRRYQWNHIVLCRNGTTVSIFVNGTRVATNGSVSGSMTLTNNTYQLMSLSTSAAAGYMFGFRTVIGSYVYDATQTSITLPTTPPTAVSNTKFLCNFTNGGITDAAAKNVFETVGGAAISTTQSKFGGSSMYFDGSGDRLVNLASSQYNLFNFGTGDFTIEFWFYCSNTTSGIVYALGASGHNLCVVYVGANATDRVSFYAAASGAGTAIKSAGTPEVSTWNHAAIVRQNGTVTVYLNGTGGTPTSNTTDITNSSYVPSIGDYNHSPLPFAGYIDDFRITKGYARYTANFTPPTTAFPTQ